MNVPTEDELAAALIALDDEHEAKKTAATLSQWLMLHPIMHPKMEQMTRTGSSLLAGPDWTRAQELMLKSLLTASFAMGMRFGAALK